MSTVEANLGIIEREILESEMRDISKRILLFLLKSSNNLSASISIWFSDEFICIGQVLAEDFELIDFKRLASAYFRNNIGFSCSPRQLSLTVYVQGTDTYGFLPSRIFHYDRYEAEIFKITLPEASLAE